MLLLTVCLLNLWICFLRKQGSCIHSVYVLACQTFPSLFLYFFFLYYLFTVIWDLGIILITLNGRLEVCNELSSYLYQSHRWRTKEEMPYLQGCLALSRGNVALGCRNCHRAVAQPASLWLRAEHGAVIQPQLCGNTRVRHWRYGVLGRSFKLEHASVSTRVLQVSWVLVCKDDWSHCRMADGSTGGLPWWKGRKHVEKEAGLWMALWMPGRAGGMLPEERKVFMTQISKKTCTINPVLVFFFPPVGVLFIS